ncbi:MAG TPA: VWA domain-containing protein [Thermoanaerobaculia bacterium]|nr:VWA domain-containing protein [Thermoanaerobaculia bacterium]
MIGLALPRLADPWFLLLLALLPLLVWRHHRRWSPGALTFSRLPRGAARGWRLHLPFYCRLAALALLVLALGRPQLGYAWEETETEGIDIQLVLDVSGSMGAEDFAPRNRLTVAKEVIAGFVADRPGDRIGLVVFAGTSLTKAPPTTDRRMLAELIADVELHSLPDGTAIGMALASAAARLQGSPAESRVIVLVTDGDNNAGQIDPDSAAAVCDGLGIKVYTVAVGTQDGPVILPVPSRNPLTGELEIRRVPWHVRVDEELLARIAARTGGEFFRATDPQALHEIFAAIDELERTPLEVRRLVRYREVFQPLAWGALALLLAPLAATAVGVTAEP